MVTGLWSFLLFVVFFVVCGMVRINWSGFSSTVTSRGRLVSLTRSPEVQQQND